MTSEKERKGKKVVTMEGWDCECVPERKKRWLSFFS